MANICSNTLEFSGKEKNVEKVYKLFNEMAIDNEVYGGALPPFVPKRNDGYMFDIYCQENCSIDYWTKWAPNEEIIILIANKYKVNFELSYEELGCGLFGKFIYDYKTKEFTDYCLDESELDMVQHNDNGEPFHKGERIECAEDVYSEMLNQKIKQDN